DKIQRKFDRRGAIAIGVTALMPPPFPTSAFVLTGGALGVDKRKFLSTVAAMRLMRFGAESLLAVFYGPKILTWFRFRWDPVDLAAGAVVVVTIIGTILTLVRIFRPVPPGEGGAAKREPDRAKP